MFFLIGQRLVGLPLDPLVLGRQGLGDVEVKACLAALARTERRPFPHAAVQGHLFLVTELQKIFGQSKPFLALLCRQLMPFLAQWGQGLFLTFAQGLPSDGVGGG